MATNPNTLAENVGRIVAPDANYTYGSAKDDTTGTTGDGTPFKKAMLNDIYGFQQAMLRAGGIVPSGTAETQLASEYLQALVQMMSGKAAFYEITGGGTDALILAPLHAGQQPVTAYFTGLEIAFRALAFNTGAATLDIGFGVMDLRSAQGAVLLAGEIEATVVMRATYHASGHWRLSDQRNFNEVGKVSAFAASSAPYGYLDADGATLSRAAYARLLNSAIANGLLGTFYGVGDGSTTFTLPDLRGEHLRGWSNGSGVDAGRALGTAQLDALQNITGSFIPFGGGSYVPTGAFSGTAVGNNRVNSAIGGGDVRLDFDASTVVRTAAETRGRNYALNFCIKY